jgi:Leucine-rich repeat (LRR) protein
MKIILLVLCLFASNLYAQDCQKILENARKAATDGNYQLAINKYTTAIDCDKNLKNKVSEELSKLFINIARLRDEAVTQKENALKAEKKAINSAKATKTALAETEKQKQIATDNLAKANKLIDAFYFYEDRFALAYGERNNRKVFYFIDKNGDEVEKLGKWDKAEQFDYTGFAYIKIDGKDHLLDTLGNTYRVAYDLANMDSRVVALDLSDVRLDSFPTPVLQHTQLQVLILNGGYSNADKNFTTLPTEITKLQNLKNLQLKFCQIDSLPAQIGELNKLTYLNLDGNKFTSLPAQIFELKNLTTLDLGSSYFSENKNQLTSLPTQIGELKNLTTLNLLGNNNSLDLASVCIAFANYPKKIVISSYEDASNSNNDANTLLIIIPNQLTSLPAQIGELKNLTQIDLRSNQLKELPSQIGGLENLTDLNLGYNQITSLPSQISNLKNLKILRLSANQFSITELNKSLALLPQLEELNLGDLGLTTLPTAVVGFTKLRKLYLKNYDEDKKNPNKFSEEEQEKIRKLLPNCEIEF